MSLKKIISTINKQIEKPFEKHKTSFFGLTVLAPTKEGSMNVKSPPTTMPVIKEGGELKYVGMDDKDTIRVYHRANAIQTSEKVASGFGDDRTLLTYTYNMTMYVFNDYKKSELTPDEIVLLIQANVKDPVIENYRTVVLRITSVVLDTQRVLKTEYNNAVSIKSHQDLFAINYTIEATFSKTCLAKCG